MAERQARITKTFCFTPPPHVLVLQHREMLPTCVCKEHVGRLPPAVYLVPSCRSTGHPPAGTCTTLLALGIASAASGIPMLLHRPRRARLDPTPGRRHRRLPGSRFARHVCTDMQMRWCIIRPTSDRKASGLARPAWGRTREAQERRQVESLFLRKQRMRKLTFSVSSRSRWRDAWSSCMTRQEEERTKGLSCASSMLDWPRSAAAASSSG